jgi:hypothetical protein
MSKEQIDEIAKFVCNACEMGGGFDGECCDGNDYKKCGISTETAEAIYNEVCSKQSEGKWQKAPDGTHWCSECGHDATYTFDGTEICGVACPFCGAKMKGV